MNRKQRRLLAKQLGKTKEDRKRIERALKEPLRQEPEERVLGELAEGTLSQRSSGLYVIRSRFTG